VSHIFSNKNTFFNRLTHANSVFLRGNVEDGIMIQREKLHKCMYTLYPCSVILFPLILAVTLSSEMYQD